MLAWGVPLLYFQRPLRALWREPVMRQPILILESDDWGPGPDSHALALQTLADLLMRFSDSQGRHPVMTLGIVLAVPDTERIKQDKYEQYHALPLSSPQCAAVLDAMRRGISAGVFAPQLHGMEHYWPASLMSAVRTHEEIREWLEQDGLPSTENLPSHLQSRWIDVSRLPSRPIPKHLIRDAVQAEVEAYAGLFGAPPDVVVPPTFVWNNTVERAWAKEGVRFIVTPGIRHEARDYQGKLRSEGHIILNGEHGRGGIEYIVRNDYFEPASGHQAQQAVSAIAHKTVLGRPVLLETHRHNYIGDADMVQASLAELEKLLADALATFPNLRFSSTAELAQYMSVRHPDWVEERVTARLHAWLARIQEIPRFAKLARISGLAAPLWALSLLARPSAGTSTASQPSA